MPAVTVTAVLLALAGMVTLGGTLATALLLLSRVTTWPAGPAGLVSATVTLPVVLGVSVSGFGVRVMAAGMSWLTVTVVLPPVRPGAEALRVAAPGVVPAVTVTAVLLALAGMVTLGGTLATALLLLSRVTTWPAGPAGLVSATVTLPVVLGVSVSG